MSNEEPSRGTWLLTRLLLLAILVSVPFGLHRLYRSMTALPETIHIATGVEGGRYREVMEALGRELASRTGSSHAFRETSGTLENMELVTKGDVDFALVQSGVQVPAELDSDNLRCVGNIYSESVLLLIRRGSDIEDGTQLTGRTVSLGLKQSGDYAAAILILDHLGLSQDEINPRFLDYSDIIDGFRNGSLDAAIVVVGLNADMLYTLADEQLVNIVSIPYAKAFASHHLSYHTVDIAAGTFQTHPQALPVDTIETVAVTSQLITREDVSNQLVLEMTKIVTDQRFQRDMQLGELFSKGADFARHRPSHTLHSGAIECYEPELKPLLPPDFVEATEGMRSFVVSSLIAIWLFLRWYRDHRSREEEHRLDAYIRTLMDIERRQMDLDEGDPTSDIKLLQQMLDEVTRLRQDALGELNAQELNDDPAAASFLDMCHALSEKISAKLTRQRFDAGLQQLAAQLTGTFPPKPTPSNIRPEGD